MWFIASLGIFTVIYVYMNPTKTSSVCKLEFWFHHLIKYEKNAEVLDLEIIYEKMGLIDPFKK